MDWLSRLTGRIRDQVDRVPTMGPLSRVDARRWREVETIQDAGELVARWLEGDMETTACCYGRPAKETELIIPALVMLNRAGFLTWGSQPGRGPELIDGEEYWQRAEVQGFSEPDVADRLETRSTESGLLTVRNEGLRRWRNDHSRSIPVSQHGDAITNESGVHASRRGVATGWHDYLTDILADAHSLSVVDPEWGRNDLLWPALTDELTLERNELDLAEPEGRERIEINHRGLAGGERELTQAAELSSDVDLSEFEQQPYEPEPSEWDEHPEVTVFTDGAEMPTWMQDPVQLIGSDTLEQTADDWPEAMIRGLGGMRDKGTITEAEHTAAVAYVRDEYGLDLPDTELAVDDDGLATPAPTDALAWCQENGVPIVDGQAVVYKAVDDLYRSGHGVDYTPGTEATATDFVANGQQGHGLHFSPTPDIARSFAPNAAHAVEVHVPLDELDVIDDKKVKARRGECVRDAEQGWTWSLTAAEPDLGLDAPEGTEGGLTEPEQATATAPAPELEANEPELGADVAPERGSTAMDKALASDREAKAQEWVDALQSGQHRQAFNAWREPGVFRDKECTVEVGKAALGLTLDEMKVTFGGPFIDETVARNDVDHHTFDQQAEFIAATHLEDREPELEL